jgi:hypothetical protein
MDHADPPCPLWANAPQQLTPPLLQEIAYFLQLLAFHSINVVRRAAAFDAYRAGFPQ